MTYKVYFGEYDELAYVHTFKIHLLDHVLLLLVKANTRILKKVDRNNNWILKVHIPVLYICFKTLHCFAYCSYLLFMNLVFFYWKMLCSILNADCLLVFALFFRAKVWNPLRKVCFLYPFKMAKTNVLTTQHKTMKNNLSISQSISTQTFTLSIIQKLMNWKRSRFFLYQTTWPSFTQ